MLQNIELSPSPEEIRKNGNGFSIGDKRAQCAREGDYQRPAKLSPTYGDGSRKPDPIFDVSPADKRRIEAARDERAKQIAIAGPRKPARVQTTRKQASAVEAALIADAPALVIEQHGGGEVINVGALDPLDADKRGSRAIRLLSAWRPETLLKRGRITRRQYSAAERLLEHWEAGGFDTIRGAQYGERIPSGQAPSSDVPHAQALRRRAYSDALAAIPSTAGPIVEAIVIEGRTIEAAAALGPDWLPEHKRTREAGTHALLCVGLDVLADHFGLPG